MKLNHLLFVVGFIFVIPFPLQAVTSLNNHVPLDSLAAVSMPIDQIPVTDTFTTNIFATIDATFGAAGIGMDEHQVETLKKTYLYLIFLTKLEKVQKNILFQQYQTDFSDYLVDNGTSFPFIPDETLVTSTGWLGVVITSQDIQNSKAWQLYTQLMIADIYVYFKIVLETIHNVEKQTFNYIPHFETSFYDADYTSFRTLNEMARTRLVLEDKLKGRWAAQCVKWSALPTVASATIVSPGTVPTQTLESAVVTFRTSPYYQAIRDPNTIVGANTTQGVSNSQLLSAPSLQSPLKEQVWCYYMLYEASGQITNFMTASNLEQVLTTCSTPDASPSGAIAKGSVTPTGSSLMPNIFPYKVDDYVLLDELLSIYSKAQGTHTSSINPSPAQYKIDDLRPADHLQQTFRSYLTEVKANLATLNASQVKAQGLFSDLAHDFEHAWSDVKNSVEAGYNAVKHLVIAAGQGLAGVGAELIGQTDWANKEFHKEEKNFDTATTDLTNCIDDFGDALKDGIIAPFAEVQGDLIGFILDDQKIGTDISTVISSVADTLVDVAAKVVDVATVGVAEVEQGVFQSVAIASEVAVVLAEGAWAIFSQKGRDEFLAEGEVLGKQCLTAIAQAYTIVLKGATKALFEAVLTGLGTIINAITTLFIDLSREVTFLFTGGIFQMYGLGNLIGLKGVVDYAEATRAHVTSVLEAHRAVINDVMGVVACIAADIIVGVATDGAGSAADVAIDAAIMGSEEGTTAAAEATEVAAEAAETAETTATTAQTALEAAQTGIKTASEKLLQLQEAGETDEVAAAQSELQEATDAAKQLEQAAKDATDASTKAAQKADNLKAAAQDVKAAKAAAQDAKTAISDAKAEVKTATEKVAKLTVKKAAQEEIDAAKAELKVAQQALKDARQLATKVAKELTQAVKTQAKLLAPTDFGGIVKTTASKFAQAIAKAARTKVKNVIDETKALGKSATNLFTKTNTKIAADAAQDVIDKQAILDALPADATDAQKAAAQADVDAAQKVADETKAIANETKFGKFKRLGKNAISAIGKLLKPVGTFMNITFNMGNIIGGYNQDAKNALDLQTQAQNLNSLWGFNNANTIATAQQQIAYLEEMEQKTQAQIGNQAIYLMLSQNILNTNIISLKNSIASALAPLYVSLLIPNPTLASTNNSTGLAMANIGTSWKLITQYLDLYPSQGFFTTTTGRPDFPFAQEIAQAPEVTNLLLSSAKGTDKLWFNQRCSARDNADSAGTLKQPIDPLTVQIDLQFLYTLESVFYAGLYLGGNYHDYDSPTYVVPFLNDLTIAGAQQALFYTSQPTLAQTQVSPTIVDFDEAHLAKMVVLYRDSKSSQLSLGVYEHEGLGWIVQSALPATLQLDQSHVYTMQVTLNQATLNIQIFVDGASLPAVEQSVTVTSIPNQRTYGIISSGAAVQWNQITPVNTINAITRTATTGTSEIDREKNNKLLLAQVLTPTFGSWTLKPWSKQAILKGQYVYGTTDTDLKKIIPTNANDLVIFAINQSGSAPLSLGLDPNTALASPNVVLISLINGTMYNAQGETVGYAANVWTDYQAAPCGPFSAAIDTLVTSQQAAVVTALSNIKFGNFVLDIVNDTALSAGQYIYTCTQTLQTAGKPMIDYLVFANFVDGSVPSLTIGMPPTAANANALFSFVSGNVYDKNTVISKTAAPTPISITYQGQQEAELGSYGGQYGLAATDPLFTTINTAGTNYTPPAPPAVKPKPNPVTVTPVVTGKPTGHVHFVFKGSTVGLRPHSPGVGFHPPKGTKDLTTRQQTAAQKVKYQLYNAGKKKNT